MRRDQLEHAIRASCQILGEPEVIVVGSQAILGTYRESELPREATMSIEADILPTGSDPVSVAERSDRIEGVAGELSLFQSTHGFYIDGVGLDTCILPSGWRDRLVPLTNENTQAPGASAPSTGWCLDKEDLCVAKLCALREKDVAFVSALLDAGMVDAEIIRGRLQTVAKTHSPAVGRALAWLASY